MLDETGADTKDEGNQGNFQQRRRMTHTSLPLLIWAFRIHIGCRRSANRLFPADWVDEKAANRIPMLLLSVETRLEKFVLLRTLGNARSGVLKLKNKLGPLAGCFPVSSIARLS